MRRLSGWLCCGLILVALPTPAETVHLTAVTQYLKGASATETWETASPGSASSLFLVGTGGQIINIFEPSGVVASEIDIPLDVGDHDFVGVMSPIPPDPDRPLDFGDPLNVFGMSLRFDGAGAPGISVAAHANPGSGPDQPFTADGDNVPTYPFDGGVVPGAGALSTSIGGHTITLTKYQFYLSSQSDRVSAGATSPDGLDDFTLKFTLHVEDASATPLPSAAMAGATLLPILILLGRHRRATK